LIERGWGFDINERKTVLGFCNPKDKTISLSLPYITVLPIEEIEETIRHELAHAFDFETRGRSDHSIHWKIWAMRCGAKPERCYKGKNKPNPKYVGVCPTCGNVRGTWYRKPRRNFYCAVCPRAYQNVSAYSKSVKLLIRENDIEHLL